MSNNATLSGLALKAVAAVVFLICAWILFKIVIGVVATVAWIVVIVLAVMGVIWALRVLT
jgi:hypothetical protein